MTISNSFLGILLGTLLFEPKTVVVIFSIYMLVNLILFFKSYKKLSRLKKIIYLIIEFFSAMWIWGILSSYDVGVLAHKDGYIQLCHLDDFDIICNLVFYVVQTIILVQLIRNKNKSKKEENPKCQE